MTTRIQRSIITLFLAIIIVAGIVVSTSTLASAHSVAASPRTQTLPASVILALRQHSTVKAQSATSGCASSLIPEAQWSQYAAVASIANPSIIYVFQTQPFYGQLPWVHVWLSTDGGKSVKDLGVHQPPFSGSGISIFYNNNIPWVIACGYTIQWIG